MADPVEAAVAVAARHGVRARDPVVLRDRLNVLVHLRPAPVVARVAGTIARVRPGDEWLRRELAVAGFLARVGAPVVAPSSELPPGPHAHEGRVLSFWTHVPDRGPVDAAAAGAALRECHQALLRFHGSLPILRAFTEAEALLARLAVEEAVDAVVAARLLERMELVRSQLVGRGAPLQPLHGDAHLGNVLQGPDGPLWNDWEDTCVGPVGWDAACLVTTSRVTGMGAERAAAALAASGIELEPEILNLWVDARTLQAAVWGAYVERDFPDRDPLWFAAALAQLRP
jgi:hypothetical protein